MADTKITGLAALAEEPASSDVFPLVDISDTSMDASGTTKKIAWSTIKALYQPIDATLTALAGVSTAADKLIYATASDTFTTTDLTSFGRSLIDDASASDARATLGLGSLATQSATISDYLTTASAASTYQPLDADLTALAALAGTNTIYYRSAADTWTAVSIGTALTFSSGTLSATRTGVVRDMWLDAGLFEARQSNGAATGIANYGTNNLPFRVFDFDATTEEAIVCKIKMPDAWDRSTIKFRAYWTAASGSGGVAIGFSAGALSDDDAIDAALGSEQTVTKTLSTAGDMHITAASSAVTVGGSPALSDCIVIQVARKVANGADTLGVDMRLIGVSLQYTESATEPSAW